MTPNHATRLLLALALLSLPIHAFAQDKSADDKPAATEPTPRTHGSWDRSIPDCRNQPSRSQMGDCVNARSLNYTIRLHNVNDQNEANEIQIAIRNTTDPYTKIYLVASQDLIVLNTYPEEFARIEALVKSLDLPRKTYRITYTIIESDSGRRLGVQHFSYLLSEDKRAQMKEGSKIPIATGKYNEGKGDSQTQFQYLDIGMNFDSTITGTATGARFKAKIEQSSIAENKMILDVAEPVIRQSVLEGVFDIPFGKAVNIGGFDVPGSTRHLDVEIQADPL